MTLTVAEFIGQAIKKTGKTQKVIAREAGFATPNVISMIKAGDSKLPLARIPAMADALDVSRQELLRLTLAEYDPELLSVLDEVLPGALLNEEEMRFIAALRSTSATR